MAEGKQEQGKVEVVFGGCCRNCRLLYRVGGPHIVAQHCIDALTAANKVLAGEMISMKERLEAFTPAVRYAWLAIMAAGGSVKVPLAEWGAVPDRGGFKAQVSEADSAMELTAWDPSRVS